MILAPGRRRQEDPEFEANLGCIVETLSKKIQPEMEEAAQMPKCWFCLCGGLESGPASDRESGVLRKE